MIVSSLMCDRLPDAARFPGERHRSDGPADQNGISSPVASLPVGLVTVLTPKARSASCVLGLGPEIAVGSDGGSRVPSALFATQNKTMKSGASVPYFFDHSRELNLIAGTAFTFL